MSPNLENMQNEGTPVDEENEEILKERAKQEKERMTEFAKSLKPEDIRNGDWFVRLLQNSLRSYVGIVNAEWFRQKYPNIPVDAIAAKRIRLAQNYNAISGGMLATAYSAAVVSSVVTAGLSLTAAGVTFAADLAMSTKIQLQLAYDLSVLYGSPIDIEDPEDMLKLIQVAFGIKAGEVFQQALNKLAPQTAQWIVKKTATGATLNLLKALPVVGKYLLQRNLVKFAIPVFGVPLSAGLNFFTTGQVGQFARKIFRDESVIREFANQTPDIFSENPQLAVGVVMSAFNADGKHQDHEINLMKALLSEWSESLDTAFLASFEKAVYVQWKQTLKEVVSSAPEMQKELYELACYAVCVDRQVSKEELKFIQEFAQAIGIEFSKEHLEKSKARWNI